MSYPMANDIRHTSEAKAKQSHEKVKVSNRGLAH